MFILILLARLGCRRIFNHSQSYNPGQNVSDSLFFFASKLQCVLQVNQFPDLHNVGCLESNLCQIVSQFKAFNNIHGV